MHNRRAAAARSALSISHNANVLRRHPKMRRVSPWPEGLGLAERITLLRKQQPALPRNGAWDARRAELRAAYWRRYRPFNEGDWLARRARIAGLTEDEFFTVIGADLERI